MFYKHISSSAARTSAIARARVAFWAMCEGVPAVAVVVVVLVDGVLDDLEGSSIRRICK